MSAISLHLHMVEKGGSSVYVSSYKDTNPVMRAPLSLSNYLPKAPPANTITLGIRTLPYELGGGHIQSIAYMYVCMYMSIYVIPSTRNYYCMRRLVKRLSFLLNFTNYFSKGNIYPNRISIISIIPTMVLKLCKDGTTVIYNQAF